MDGVSEDNVFFLKVRDLRRKEVHTCASDATVAEVAALLRDRNVSGLVVCAGRLPVGVITDRDVRNKVVVPALDPRTVRASAVMSSPLITVRDDDYVFDVVYTMTRHRIHRVVVVDAAGSLCGVVTESDVVRLQTNTPSYLLRDLEHAVDLGELRKVNERVTELVVHLIQSGVKTRDLVRLISNIHDAVILRAIELLVEERRWDLPRDFAFLVLGSEGRMEQTLLTDQDNAIVYGDGLGPEETSLLEAFSRALIDRLIAIGVPECPGGMMARNAEWRRTLSAWTSQIAQWGSRPTPENILRYSMFADLRTLHGNGEFEVRLKEHIVRHIRQNSVFLAQLAKNILRFPPPLGLFGNVKTIKTGPHRGRLDVKKAGIFQISEGVKVLSLEAGFLEGGTREKLEHLEQRGALSAAEAGDLEASYNFLVFVRLRSQVQELVQGGPLTNFIDPGSLSHVELMRLKIGLKTVKEFHNLLHMHYRLNFVSD